MSTVTTHVLDAAAGLPAVGIPVTLTSSHGEVLAIGVTNSDGRVPELGPDALPAGTYRLTFDVAAYFKARGVQLPEPSFLNKVSLDFGVANVDQHYHVPLLVSPWSYSTYRGS